MNILHGTVSMDLIILPLGGCTYPPDTFLHFSMDTDWQCFQKPIGGFQTDMFLNFSKLLDYADMSDLTYYLAVFRAQQGNFVSNNPRKHYNHWFSESTIFYNTEIPFHGVSTPMEVLSHNNAFAVQTNTMKYYIDQWGDREGIFYWEPIVEINYVGDTTISSYANSTIKNNWIRKIIDYMHRYEIQKYGRKHLVSISCGLANPSEIGYDGLKSIKYNSSAISGHELDALSFSSPNWYSTISTQKCFYNNPKLDFVSIHPIIGDSTHWVTNFPLQSLATVGGENSLWYDKTSNQWLVDSAVLYATLAIHSAVNMGFSLMTANIPYLNTEQGPDNYNAPWVLSKDYGDSYENGTCATDRHIAENLHRAMNHFGLYTHMLSGGGGPGNNIWISGV